MMNKPPASPIVASNNRQSSKHLSHPKTTARILQLLEGVTWATARAVDVGAGRGYFSMRLANMLSVRHGLKPEEHVYACDVEPEIFEFDTIQCGRIGNDGRLPYPDNYFDVVVSIEVIEHVEDQFRFYAELQRIARPGGMVIVTTPNVLSMQSRFRSLLVGFPELYNPLPLSIRDPATGVPDKARMFGHIHPISPYFLTYIAQRTGLTSHKLHGDRLKRSSLFIALVLSVLLLLAQAHFRLRLRRKQPQIYAENRAILNQISSLQMLASRTCIIASR
jgi:ubiquinone/menaquinone biosynthesis C-methylase UbiE